VGVGGVLGAEGLVGLLLPSRTPLFR